MRGQIQDIEPEQIHLRLKKRGYWSKARRACRSTASGQYQNQTWRNQAAHAKPGAYIANILDHDITFGVGPAGTVKPTWQWLRQLMP